MVGERKAASGQNQALGKGLVAMGTIFFAGEILYGLVQLVSAWEIFGHLGWLAAAGMELLRVVNGIAWNHSAMLAGSVDVLVLCWPLALVAAGTKLMRRAAQERN
ncbi:MAG TPA: hypothetical protein VLV88_10685 [Terriglobales bacterium]|nr:hypothetical protein [Terriglobales bacterium]